VIAKEGRSLRVRVTSDKENVSVNVPLHLALQTLPDEHGHVRTAALASALSSVRFTDLVECRTARTTCVSMFRGRLPGRGLDGQALSGFCDSLA
jgi:hypothetical protein